MCFCMSSIKTKLVGIFQKSCQIYLEHHLPYHMRISSKIAQNFVKNVYNMGPWQKLWEENFHWACWHLFDNVVSSTLTNRPHWPPSIFLGMFIHKQECRALIKIFLELWDFRALFLSSKQQNYLTRVLCMKISIHWSHQFLLGRHGSDHDLHIVHTTVPSLWVVARKEGSCPKASIIALCVRREQSRGHHTDGLYGLPKPIYYFLSTPSCIHPSR